MSASFGGGADHLPALGHDLVELARAPRRPELDERGAAGGEQLRRRPGRARCPRCATSWPGGRRRARRPGSRGPTAWSGSRRCRRSSLIGRCRGASTFSRTRADGVVEPQAADVDALDEGARRQRAPGVAVDGHAPRRRRPTRQRQARSPGGRSAATTVRLLTAGNYPRPEVAGVSAAGAGRASVSSSSMRSALAATRNATPPAATPATQLHRGPARRRAHDRVDARRGRGPWRPRPRPTRPWPGRAPRRSGPVPSPPIRRDSRMPASRAPADVTERVGEGQALDPEGGEEDERERRRRRC